MYFDGSLKLGSGGAGVLFISLRGEQLKYVFQILFEVSNDKVEYEALLHRLRRAVSLGIKRLLVYGDSLLVVQGVGCQQGHHGRVCYGDTQAREQVLGVGNPPCDSRQQCWRGCALQIGFYRANVPLGVFVHELHHPSIKAPDSSSIAQGPKEPDREVLMIEIDWRVTFIDYIQEHKLPPIVDPKKR
jgi:hypothetical protein